MVLLLSPRSMSSQGQGHCKFKVIPESNCKYLDFYHEAGGGPSTERHSCLNFINCDTYFSHIIVDMGREEVDRNNGLHSLLELMKTQLNSTDDGCAKLRMVLCGFLLNLTNTHGKNLSILHT